MYRFRTRSFDAIEPLSIAWIWPGVLPLGKLTLIAGDPGLGKSFIAYDIAARLSRLAPWPAELLPGALDAPRELGKPAHVLLLSAEDDPADTIRPRLESAGADLSRITEMDGIIEPPGFGGELVSDVSLDRHAEALEEYLDLYPEIRLIVIDPITAYSGDIDINSNVDVRRMLRSLAALAAKKQVAILAVSHLRKQSGDKAVYRTMGSLAFTAAPRMVWLVTRDPDDPSARLMTPIKANISHDLRGIRFRIQDGRVAWDPLPVAASADDVVDASRARAGRPAPEEAGVAARAIAFLELHLADGPRPAAQMERLAATEGVSSRALRTARSTLGVVARRVSDGWSWSLPGVRSLDELPERHLPFKDDDREEGDTSGGPGVSPSSPPPGRADAA